MSLEKSTGLKISLLGKRPVLELSRTIPVHAHVIQDHFAARSRSLHICWSDSKRKVSHVTTPTSKQIILAKKGHQSSFSHLQMQLHGQGGSFIHLLPSPLTPPTQPILPLPCTAAGTQSMPGKSLIRKPLLFVAPLTFLQANAAVLITALGTKKAQSRKSRKLPPSRYQDVLLLALLH